MCGRFVTEIPVDVLTQILATIACEPVKARYNIAPTQHALVVRQRPNGERVGQHLRWGLIPSWSKDAASGAKLINARAETVAEKPSFRAAYRARRCVVPISGFYEWAKEGKRPFYLRPTQGPLFALAGIWERWAPEGGEAVDTFSIITTAANGLMQRIHDRMPVILGLGDVGAWLNRETPAEEVGQLLRPCPEDWMAMHPVSSRVGNVRNDDPELIRNVDEGVTG